MLCLCVLCLKTSEVSLPFMGVGESGSVSLGAESNDAVGVADGSHTSHQSCLVLPGDSGVRMGWTVATVTLLGLCHGNLVMPFKLIPSPPVGVCIMWGATGAGVGGGGGGVALC